MALAVRESPGANSAAAATTVTVNLGTTTVGGELILAVVGEAAGTTGNLSSITDTAGGNALTLGTGFSAGSTNTYLNWGFLANAPAGITGIKTTLTTGKTHSLQLIVVTGAATASPQDGTTATGSDAATATTHASTSVTTTNAADIVVAAINFDSTPGTITDPSSPWIMATVGGLAEVRVAYQIVAATGSYSATWTNTTAVRAAYLTMGFKAAAAAAGASIVASRRHRFSGLMPRRPAAFCTTDPLVPAHA
jgi:hypothetical protein